MMLPDLLTDLRLQLKHQGIPVAVDPTNGVMHLPESLLFDSGSADFKLSGLRALAILGRELERELPCYTFGRQPSYCPPGSRPIISTRCSSKGIQTTSRSTTQGFSTTGTSQQRAPRAPFKT